MATRYILLILMTFFLLNGQAKNPDKYLKKANSAFDSHQYQLAIDYYEKTLDKVHTGIRADKANHRLAQTYNIIHQYELSSSYYKKISTGKYADKHQEVWLEYAQILMKTTEYNEALKYFQKYLEKNPGSFIASNGIKSCNMALELSNTNGGFELKNIQVLNSIADEFGVTFISKNYKQIVITSNREQSSGKGYDAWTGKKFSDLFESNMDGKGNWDAPSILDSKNIINTEEHEGVPFYVQKSKTLYFTRCPRVVDTSAYCQIWAAKRQGNTWSLPFLVLSDPSSNMGHPALSSDELTMYFSSNRSEGFGGKDIWVARREKSSKPFGEPVNLGPEINTELDEMFPFIKNDTLLYFSSNGHPGFGGLDIFCTRISSEQSFSIPLNLLPPINSSGNDFAIVFHPEKEEGFISSNRKGGKGGDDIYLFKQRDILFKIEGQVSDIKTQLSLPNSNLYLISTSGDSIQAMANLNGIYSFIEQPVKDEHDYTLVAAKPDYFSNKRTFNTRTLKSDHVFVFDFFLEPIPDKPIVLPEILYDYAKWDIKPQYQDSLMVLLDVLSSNPNLVIEIRSHTDSRNNDEFNDELSQKRAQSVIDFLFSKGVETDRMIAKGYGKRMPRTLDKDFYFKTYKYPSGIVLNDNFINKLPTSEQKEFAHQLNRRTEFAIVSKNHVPSKTQSAPSHVNIITDENKDVISFEFTADSLILIEIGLNEYTINSIIKSQLNESVLDEETALLLLEKGYINNGNFVGIDQNWLEKGHIKKGTYLTIDRVRLGSLVIKNVKFAISTTEDKQVILGQEFIKLFKIFSIGSDMNQITIEY
jgi:peptidoglycan-associated lipoprotein